ncbi:MAG TPA: FAD-binding oxidoreductase [Acetobacteraceae bacterium]|nr:FAD-binding oxidoreductase [Acetobacteraceae bacterium]
MASEHEPAAASGLEALIPHLRTLLGQRGFLTGAEAEPYCEDWRRLAHGRTPAVLRPADTAEVAEIMRLCTAHRVPVVPQGGNTSMVVGATPDASGTELVLSLERLRQVRAIDPLDMTMTVEAGLTLAAAREAAAASGCMFPLTIASEGSAQIGGVLATNAGGNNTVRYGNARDLVLGVEVVLADGSVINALRKLRKDNTGYCLRQLFVGSEGTLGIITAAVLKLVPQPRAREVAFCAVSGPEAALELFSRLQRHDAASLQAFEYVSGPGIALVLRHIPGATLPLSVSSPAYVLIEVATSREDATLRDALESVLAQALEEDLVQDAVIAENEAQRIAIWRLREEHSEAQKREGASVKNDVSVPVSRTPALIARASEVCARLVPGIRPVPFGHMGDGNIHFNLLQPVDADPAAFLARQEELMEAVAEVVHELEGSFSAEHGVGKLKTGLMPSWRGGAELETMRRIKQALDPLGLFNPGTMLPPEGNAA